MIILYYYMVLPIRFFGQPILQSCGGRSVYGVSCYPMGKKIKKEDQHDTKRTEDASASSPLPSVPPPSLPVPPSPPIQGLHLWEIQGIRDILVLAGIVLIFFIGYWLRSVTIPLLLALTFAYLFEPLVEWVCRRRNVSRPGVVGGLIGILGVGFLVIAVTVIPLLIFQTVEFVQGLPRIYDNAITAVSEAPAKIRNPIESALGHPITYFRLDEKKKKVKDGAENGEGAGAVADSGKEMKGGENGSLGSGGDFVQYLRDNVGSIFQFTVKTSGEAFRLLTSIAGSVLYAGFLLFLIPFYFYYFSTSWPNIRRFVRQNLPPEHFKHEYELLGMMNIAIAGFVRGRIVISAIMGIMLAIGWAFCGVPYWLILGLLTGVLCAVPYLGGIGIPVAVILLFLGQGNLPVDERMAWWGVLLWPTLVFVVVQTFEGYVLTPYIAGKATNLGPVSILVAVLAGGVVLGIYGMLLAIPAMACIKILFTEVFLPRVQQWSSGEAEDILPIE